jgi:hypothetical protein
LAIPAVAAPLTGGPAGALLAAREERRDPMASNNSEFEIRGVNHLALVCKDMAKTVTFYRDVLACR